MSQKKKIILIAMGILVVAVVGVLLAIGNRQENQKDNDNQEITNPTEPTEHEALLGETFTDPQAGVTVRLPKGWQLTPKNPDHPGSLTKFTQTQSQANGELLTRKSSGDMDSIVRDYLEAALNISVNSKLINNETVTIGNKTGRLVSHDVPGPNGQSARITQYIFYKDDTYYILAFTTLATDWETQRPGIEASAESLEIQ